MGHERGLGDFVLRKRVQLSAVPGINQKREQIEQSFLRRTSWRPPASSRIVGIPDQGDTLFHHNPILLGQRAVTPRGRRQIDDHRPASEMLECLRGYQYRGGTAGIWAVVITTLALGRYAANAAF